MLSFCLCNIDHKSSPNGRPLTKRVLETINPSPNDNPPPLRVCPVQLISMRDVHMCSNAFQKVITGWCQEDLHPICWRTHSATARPGRQPIIPGTRQKAFNLHHIKTVIAPETTAVLQLTDIMAAKKCKDIVHAKKHELRRLLKRAAINENVKPAYKCGPRELLWVTNQIQMGMEEWQDADN